MALVCAVLGGLAVVGCAGGTDPATNVTSLSAQLNAHGKTTGKPATWWWEYSTNQADLGTAADTEVCGNGTGPPEADNRCGPAQADNSGDIPLNFVARGLKPSTTYYFRACGQDQGASQGACAATLSFTTLAGTSYAFDRKWFANGSGGIMRGVALSSNGNVHVADYSANLLQVNTPAGAFVRQWSVDTPADVALDSADNVYVTGANCRCVRKFSPTGTAIGQWGSFGSGNGQFSNISGIAIDSSDNVYVVDSGGWRIQKFTSGGAYVTQWGSTPPGQSQLGNPEGIAISGGNVYVANAGTHEVVQWTTTGSFVRRWGTGGTGDGQFSGPWDVGVDSAGNVWVTERDGDRVQKFDSTGTFITKLGTSGTNDGQFDLPRGVAVDRFDNVYVSDFTGRLQKFKPAPAAPAAKGRTATARRDRSGG